MRDKADTMKSLGRVLRRQVTIQRSTVEYTEAGDPREAWEDWQVVWAERQNLWGQEYYAAKAAGEENTIVFVVRYGPYIEQLNTVDFRLVEGGKIYGIRQIDRLDDADEWVKIRALERGHGD